MKINALAALFFAGLWLTGEYIGCYNMIHPSYNWICED
jgi:hypothetical protein